MNFDFEEISHKDTIHICHLTISSFSGFAHNAKTVSGINKRKYYLQYILHIALRKHICIYVRM